MSTVELQTRALRDAIPELHDGRELELDSVQGQPIDHPFLGTMVELRCVVKETGKLSGEFVVRMGLQVEAARGLAATLSRLADEAEEGERLG